MKQIDGHYLTVHHLVWKIWSKRTNKTEDYYSLKGFNSLGSGIHADMTLAKVFWKTTRHDGEHASIADRSNYGIGFLDVLWPIHRFARESLLSLNILAGTQSLPMPTSEFRVSAFYFACKTVFCFKLTESEGDFCCSSQRFDYVSPPTWPREFVHIFIRARDLAELPTGITYPYMTSLSRDN